MYQDVFERMGHTYVQNAGKASYMAILHHCGHYAYFDFG